MGFCGNFHHKWELGDFWLVDKNSNIDKQFCTSFLRLNLGRSVRGGFGLIILVFKFGWKSVIFSKRDWHRRNNIFPYLWSNWRYLLGGAKSGGIIFIIICSLIGRINSLYILYLYVLYFYCITLGIYICLFVEKIISCLLFLLQSRFRRLEFL